MSFEMKSNQKRREKRERRVLTLNIAKNTTNLFSNKVLALNAIHMTIIEKEVCTVTTSATILAKVTISTEIPKKKEKRIAGKVN